MKKVLLLLTVACSTYAANANTVTVTNINDSGGGSLREATTLVNDGDTIRFNSNIISSSSATITLTSEITINKGLTFIGLYNNSDTLYISGNNTNRIFNVDLSSATVKQMVVDSMVLIDGNAISGSGGAISVVDGNSFNLSNSVIRGNTASNNGGGVYTFSSISSMYVTVSNSTFNNNSTGTKGGGIYVSSNPPSTTITTTIISNNCTFNNNTSGNSGAAIYIGATKFSTRATVTDSRITNNISGGGWGGGISARSVALTSSACIVTVTRSTVSGNSSFRGGGISSNSNSWSSFVTITSSTVSDNTSTLNGGGIYSFGGSTFASDVIITNSTISNNSTTNATTDGGGICLLAVGWVTVGVTNSSITNNFTGGDGKGIYAESFNGVVSNVNIVGSIISNGGADIYNSLSPTIVSSGYNIFEDATVNGSIPSDQLSVTPVMLNLGVLQNNGGTTETRLPGAGSVAINTGDPSDVTNAQNGPINGTRDIGSAEVLACVTVNGTDVQTICGSYTWINGSTYNSSTNSPTYNLNGGAANGCDSLVTLNLTINNSTIGTDVQTACGSYIWINGTTYNASTNSPTYNLSGGAANGCDSLVTLNLTINNSTTGTDMQTACESFTWINGTTYSSSTNSPTFNMNGGAANGCDSLVTLNLTIINSTTGTDVHTACGSYTWINGTTYNATNNSPTFNITGGAANGCDSLVTLNLTINNSTTGTDVQTACGSYSWINGTTYNSSTSSPTYNLSGGAANGCDSLVTLNLTINNSTTGTDVQTACGSFTWINGTTYNSSTSSPTFNMTGAAANGCDSLVTLNLTIINSTTGTDVQTACGSYTWINGTIYNSSTTSPTFNITGGAANGCDSLVTLNLTINNSTTGTDVQTACGSYTWINGTTYNATTSSPTFNITGGAANGCDSLVTLNLTVNSATAGIDLILTCDLTYTWLNGVTYNSNINTVTHTVLNSVGCDSIITLDLNFLGGFNTTVSQNGNILTANQVGATYQWIDCYNGNSIIAGETNASYTATANGDYAVIVTMNGCVDTSACVNIATVGVNENTITNQVSIYPNPTKSNVMLQLGNLKEVSITVYSLTGKIVYEAANINTTRHQFSLNSAAGFYIVNVTANGAIQQFKLIKE